MGQIELDAEEKPDLWAWRATPGMLGVRLNLARRAAREWLSDGTADCFWAAAEEAGVPTMVCTPGHVVDLVPTIERHPTLRLVIGHAGLLPSGPPIDVEALVEEAVSLARFSAVAVKASAL